jgi:hypothetical protein
MIQLNTHGVKYRSKVGEGCVTSFQGRRNLGAKRPPPQVFRKHKKCPLSDGKVPFAFVKNVAQIAFFIWLQLFVLQKTQKMPSLWWQSALCLCENCCSDCILYDCNYFSCLHTPPPPPVANISGKDFSGALFIPKVPLETGAHQSFDASYAPASFTAWKIFTHFTDPIGSKGDHQQHYDFRLGRWFGFLRTP